MLERVLQLYEIETLCVAVRSVLSEFVLVLFKRLPSLVVDMKKVLLDFISNRNNVGNGREEFFLHIVWVVGEYASAQQDERCDTTIMVQYHEVSP